MKAKTKLQKHVVGLSKTLKPITEAQKRYGRENAFWHYGRETKDHIYCHDCCTKFKKNQLLNRKCPACKRSLKINKDRSRKFHDCGYMMLVDALDGFQIVRIFVMYKNHKLGEYPKFVTYEVIQHWINDQGQITTVARLRHNSYGMYNNSWSYSMEVREYDRDKYDFGGVTYPIMKLLPQVKFARKVIPKDRRLSLTQNIAIWANPKAETLYKAGFEKLFSLCIDERRRINRFWPSIKICIRNKYHIEQPSSWLDFLEDLRYFGADINNPFYICPADFHSEHRILNNARENIREAIRKAKQRGSIIERCRKYVERIKNYESLVITDGTLSISPLQSINDFRREGKAMKHCVYTSGYYERENSLILSAKINGERIETVEYSLLTGKVVQSQGYNDKPTKYHKRIVKLVNEKFPRRIPA